MAAEAGKVITVVLTLALFILIYMPIIFVNGHKTCANRQHIVFKKRWCKISIIVIFIIVNKLLFESVVLTVKYLIPNIDDIGMLELLFSCVDSLFEFGILYCWVWRFWLLSYECKLLVYMNKNKWQSIINDHYYKNKQDAPNYWYLENKKSFGNYYFCGKYIIIPLLLTSSLVKIALLVLQHYAIESNIAKYIFTSFDAINYLIPLFILLNIFRGIPKVWDNFYICSELRKICMVLIIDDIAYITRLFLELNVDNDNYKWLIDVIQINLTCFAQFVCVMIATHWVNNKVSNIIQNNKFELFNIEESRMPLINVRSKTVTTFSSNPINQPSLTDILSNYKSVDIFTKHLMAEYSIECLMSLVEMLQFQQFVYKKYFRNFHYSQTITEDYFHESLFKKINFPNSVPKSKIIYGKQYTNTEYSINNNQTQFVQSTSKSKSNTKNKSKKTNFNDIIALHEDQEIATVQVNQETIDNKSDESVEDIKKSLTIKAKQIYLKYIAVGSHYEVNIAWCLRNRLIKLFNSNDNNNKKSNGKVLNEFDFCDYIDLYDEVCNEMYKLMRDSYDRFRRKNEYQKLKKTVFTFQ
eukprot:57086_1